jgi:hypothetical protein
LRRKVNAADLKEMDYAAYIASASDTDASDDENPDVVRAKVSEEE